MPYYFLEPCRKCGLIDSTYHFTIGKHLKCPHIDFNIDKQSIIACNELLISCSIPTHIISMDQHWHFWWCINFINEYPDIDAVSTRMAIRRLNDIFTNSAKSFDNTNIQVQKHFENDTKNEEQNKLMSARVDQSLIDDEIRSLDGYDD